MAFLTKSLLLKNIVFLYMKSKLPRGMLEYLRNFNVSKNTHRTLHETGPLNIIFQRVFGKKGRHSKDATHGTNNRSLYKSKRLSPIAKSKVILSKSKKNYFILLNNIDGLESIKRINNIVSSKSNVATVLKQYIKDIISKPIITDQHLFSQNKTFGKYKQEHLFVSRKICLCRIPLPPGIISKFLPPTKGYYLAHKPFILQNKFCSTAPYLRRDKKRKEPKNLTAVLYGVNDLRLEERPIPKPKSNQVLLKMEVVGICGSDVHFLVDGRIGPFVVEKPMVIGHEASGTVVEVGRNVKHLKEGDHVAIEPGIGCRMCKYCKRGRYNLCPKMKFCANPPVDGNLARFYVHDADFCFKLPSHVSVEEGALLEPLSCSVRACKVGEVTVGSTVLILGAGPIGLTSLLAAKAYGASKVVIIDLNESRLELAEKLGANCTIQIYPDDEENDVIGYIYEAFDNKQPSVSIECSGAEMATRIAVLVTKSGGKAVLVGLGKTEINLPLGSVLFREVDIKGVFRYVNDYPTSLDMVATGKVDVLPLITHQFPLEETLQAFETARTGEGNAVKVLIRPNSDSNSDC